MFLTSTKLTLQQLDSSFWDCCPIMLKFRPARCPFARYNFETSVTGHCPLLRFGNCEIFPKGALRLGKIMTYPPSEQKASNDVRLSEGLGKSPSSSPHIGSGTWNSSGLSYRLWDLVDLRKFPSDGTRTCHSDTYKYNCFTFVSSTGTELEYYSINCRTQLGHPNFFSLGRNWTISHYRRDATVYQPY